MNRHVCVAESERKVFFEMSRHEYKHLYPLPRKVSSPFDGALESKTADAGHIR